jgi:hypothetical protein
MIPRIFRFFPRGYWALVPAAFALLVACSDDKPAAQSTSANPPPQESPKASLGSNSGADQSTARYFANSKAVAPTSVDRPVSKGDLSFTIDILDVKDKGGRVRGWAFRLTPPHQKGDRVTLLLVSPGATYSILADVEMRPDVSSVLKQPGLDDTGFVSLIDTSGLPPGEYTIFLRIGGTDGEAIKSTDRTLTL